MSKDIYPEDEYKLFLNNEIINQQNEVDNKLIINNNQILKELVASKFKLGLTFFLLSLLGYILNLSICAQGPLGLTRFSHEVFRLLHLNFHSCICAFVCGFTLTSMPFALAFAFLNPFQRRFLLFRMSWFLIAIPFFATALIFIWTLHPLTLPDAISVFGIFDLKMEVVNGVVWTVSALCMPVLLQFYFYRRNRQKNYLI